MKGGPMISARLESGAKPNAGSWGGPIFILTHRPSPPPADVYRLQTASRSQEATNERH